MVADSKISILETIRPDQTDATTPQSSDGSAPAGPVSSTPVTNPDTSTPDASTPDASSTRDKLVLVADNSDDKGKDDKAKSVPATAEGSGAEGASSAEKKPIEYLVLPNGIGVMRANYTSRKDFIEVRGGCPKGLNVAFAQLEGLDGEVFARVPCKPPSNGYPEDYPAFMQGSDWFALRKGNVFGKELSDVPNLVLRFLDAGEKEVARLETPVRVLNTPAAPPTGIVAPPGTKEYHISIDQFFFERHWNVMSIRGCFYSINGAQAVEVWADKVKVGDAQLGLHRPLSKLTPDPANGFALETPITVDLLKHERIHLRCVDKAGKVFRRSLPATHLERSPDESTLYYNKRWNDLVAKTEKAQTGIARWRGIITDLRMRLDLGRAIGGKIAPHAPDTPERVLLFVNNVNPGGRPEKWEYFLRLHEEFMRSGFELVVAQQGNAASPEDPPMTFVRMTDMRTWMKPVWSSELRQTGRTKADFLTMVHEASTLDYGYEDNKRNIVPTWLESYSSTLQLARAADKVLTTYKPKVCLVWHEWNQASHVCKWLCDAYGIPTLFCHDGALPMTMGMDPIGEMAESTPVAKADTYYAQPLAKIDRKRAIGYRNLVTETGMNRKSTVADGSLSRLLSSVRESGKKILFYAGCNDWQTGMLPVWWDKSQIHSPIFVDSYDGFRYLSDLCERRDWILLFKPHPHLEPKRLDLSTSHVIFVREANIHECVRQSDVCLTLVSATAYMSLFNERPTILLGRNSLSRSGCCYEPQELGDIPEAIDAALKGEGFAEMQKRWMDHLARMIRYTLHPMHPDSERLMGKRYADTARFIIKQAKFSPVLHNAR